MFFFPCALLAYPPHGRYGAACLESTRLAGLANEVDPISAGPLALSSGAHVSFVELSRGATSGEVGVRKAAGEEVRKGGKGEGLKREVGVVEAVRREEQGERDTRREDKLWEMIKCVLFSFEMSMEKLTR